MSVPQLRFKDGDGQDFPEWEDTNLESCGTFFRGGSLSKSDIDTKGQFSCVHYGELFTTYHEIITTVKSKTNITNTINSEYGDILMPSSDVTPAGLAKASCLLQAGVVIGGDINVIRLKKNLAPIFISYLLNFEKNKIIQLVSGTTVKHIYIKDIKSIELSIPTEIAEQTKIANFLTAVDEKITQLSQKHDLLTQYKKGVMQQIFSQELRFKDDDGEDFPEWEEHLLGNVATLFNGRAYKQTEWEDTGTPVIRLQNLTGSGDTYYYSNIKLPANQYCNTGDLLYMWSATFGPVWWQGEKAIYHYHIWKIDTDNNNLSKNYLFYVLDDITAKMKRTSNGSTMAHITKGGMEKLALTLPSVVEQTKIANFLTAIDDKITNTQEQLKALKQYKSGLLQQMFV